jgi:hypothetical protein
MVPCWIRVYYSKETKIEREREREREVSHVTTCLLQRLYSFVITLLTMGKEQCWNNIDRGNRSMARNDTFRWQFLSWQIPYGLVLDRTWVSEVKGRRTYHRFILCFEKSFNGVISTRMLYVQMTVRGLLSCHLTVHSNVHLERLQSASLFYWSQCISNRKLAQRCGTQRVAFGYSSWQIH